MKRGVVPCSLAAMALLTLSTAGKAAVPFPQASEQVSQPEAPVTRAVMPLPARLAARSGPGYRLTPGFRVVVEGADSPVMEEAVGHMLQQLSDRIGVPLSRQAQHSGSASLVIQVQTPSGPVQALGDDESYRMTVNEQGVRVEAPNQLGAMHALQTMLQLAQPDGAGSYWLPPVTVDDAPRFPWRGLMIDCSRHFEPMDVLKRNLDAMAAVKLNVFHWHLVDDQGFRMESKAFPKLTAVGSDGEFYTQAQAREIVAYAHARGIRVVPEFEMPGHSAAWLVAYPELSSGTVPDGIRREFGVSDTALDPTREETYKFLAVFLREMTTIFPDEYVHIGGDETPAPDWKTNPRIVAFEKAHNLSGNAALQAYFNQRVLKILTGLNRRMVGWDEILDPALPKSVVIQSWRGVESLAKGAEEGYEGVLSAPYYLDGMKPAGQMYLDDPIPANSPLTVAQQKLILGGEVCMWAEHLNARTIDSRIWPRTAALAERLWSPANVRNVDDLYRRLTPVSLELERIGVRQLTSEGAGLRGLAGTEQIDALQTFASAFEPVSFGERASVQHTDHWTPLTGFVDAVVPDPPVRFALAHAAAVLTGGAASSDEREAAQRTLGNFFTRTGASVPEVQAQMQHAPGLAVMAGRAAQLQQLSQVGTQALGYLVNGGAPAGWRQQSLATIADARKPDALVRFDFLDALETLVKAVQGAQ